MLKQHRIRNTFLLGMLPYLFSLSAGAVTYPYLEDADLTKPPVVSGAPSISNHKFPRTMLGDPYVDANLRYAKYNIIGAQASRIKEIGQIQQTYPDLMYFRMYTPRETQEYKNTVYCSQGKAIPFEGNAATTGGCKVYPGHWLYRAGVKTTSSTTATATKFNVTNGNKFTVGRYVVIYDSPVASFKNAEHAEIIAKNATSITVKRGYKSTKVFHPTGAIVAQHVIGQAGGDPRNWAYNLSTQSPKDASGRQIGPYLALFLKNNLKKDWKGQTINVNVSGILFDVDYNFELQSKLSDVNNDLVTDHGISPNGVNWYGNGVDVFYTKVRQYFPKLFIVGGTPRSRGEGIISGTQFEGWLTGFEGKPVDFTRIDQQLSNYTYHMHNQAGPIHSNILMKQGTKIYPVDGISNPISLFRLGLGTALLEDGYYGQVTTKNVPDTWYDEFAVDVEKNSPTYGQAIKATASNVATVRKHRGWLGMPLGPRKRIYDNSFAPSKSLISNSSFDSNINSWSGSKVNISRVTNTKMDGAGALRLSKHTSYQSLVFKAFVRGPSPSLSAGKEYTLTFSAKAPVMREITAKVGSSSQSFLIGPKWRRYVMTFKAASSGGQKVQFSVGLESTEVFLDTVHLFEGNASVFRRDFDNGIVIVNATQKARTINLGGVFQKIQGSQAPSINNGSSSSSVTLAKMDAILLVRPDNATPSADKECGKPTYNAANKKAIYLWKDCAGDGKWRFRVTGGGSSSAVTYKGSISSITALTAVTGFSLEASDVLNTSDPYNIKYTLMTANSGEDGVNFRFPQSSSACFNATTHSNVFLGSGSVNKSLPLNLSTLGSCTVPKPGPSPGDQCGFPAGVNPATDKGTFIWKECGKTGDWIVAVVGGGSSTVLKYTGNVTSPDPITASSLAFESNDILNTTYPRFVSYKMNVKQDEVDAVRISVSNKGGCYTSKNLAGGDLYLGPAAIPISSSLDLLTLSSCN